LKTNGSSNFAAEPKSFTSYSCQKRIIFALASETKQMK